MSSSLAVNPPLTIDSSSWFAYQPDPEVLSKLQANPDFLESTIDLDLGFNRKISNVNTNQKAPSVSAAANANLEKTIRKHESKSLSACKFLKYFKRFEGYWILTSIDDWDTITLIQFYVDEADKKHPKGMAKFYDGTQKYIRELAPTDNFRQVPVITNPAERDTCEVQLLNKRALRFYNSGEILSTDQLHSTFKIQDNDDNLAYAVFWSDWDGGADSPKYGYSETLTQYRRLPERPEIQLNSLPSLIDWTNPVNKLLYLHSYFTSLVEPQHAASLNNTNYIGWANANALIEKYLTTGIKRTAKISTAFRGTPENGPGYIGIWKTQAGSGNTAIFTEEPHQFNNASIYNITGLKGQYASVTGIQRQSRFGSSIAGRRNNPQNWVDQSSDQFFISIELDTSAITEPYNPNIHGVGFIESQVGPVTPTTQYRELMSVFFDYIYNVYGSSTHNRMFVYRDSKINSIPDTYNQLQTAINNNTAILTGYSNARASYSRARATLHWNCTKLGFPVFSPNDPFKLGTFAATYNYDIDINNYLEPGSVRTIFYAITGPVLPNEPITGQLTPAYSSNGSKVVFTTGEFGKTPAPLVDEFGTHNWMAYRSSYNPANPTAIDGAAQYGFLCGFVDKKWTDGKTVPYIRWLDELPADYAVGTAIFARSLVYGIDGLDNRLGSSWTGAFAAMARYHNTREFEEMELDIRTNQGGAAQAPAAIAVVFGGNRKFPDNGSLGFPGNGQQNPLPLLNSGIQTAYDSIPAWTNQLLNVDQVAKVLGDNSVYRGRNGKKLSLKVLDSIQAGSAGDILGHMFLSTNPNTRVHDIGGGVFSQIIGDIDGKLFSGVKGYDALPVDQFNPQIRTASGAPASECYLGGESGFLHEDPIGYIDNPTPWTQPKVLLQGWFDQVEWPSLGVIPTPTPFALGDLKPQPVFNDPKTWRDPWFEAALKAKPF